MPEHNQPTRREFLTKSAAAGALIGFPAIVPARPGTRGIGGSRRADRPGSDRLRAALHV